MVHQVISKVLVKTRLRSPNWGNYCWKKYLLMPQSWYVYLPYTFVWVLILGQGKLCAIRDLSEIAGVRGGGWKQREGHNFLRLRKREGS